MQTPVARPLSHSRHDIGSQTLSRAYRVLRVRQERLSQRNAALKGPDACIFPNLSHSCRTFILETVANAFNVALMSGKKARDRNKWPNTVAEPFFKTVSQHYRGIASPVARRFATKSSSVT